MAVVKTPLERVKYKPARVLLGGGPRTASEATEVDQQIAAVHGMHGVGHFLIDRQSIVRWTHLEAGEGMAGLVTFPRDAQILEAARALAR